MTRNATAIWKGGLKDGSGQFSVQSGQIKDVAYDFGKRFGNDPGTNPEELIAAAHSACFSMALSGQLQERGVNPESITTIAHVTMENLALTKSHLETTVVAPGADRAKVEEAWNAAKTGCPISKALNVEITLDGKFDG